MSAVVLPRIGGREVYRCECGLIQFPTKDGKCRKVSCRLPFVEEEPEGTQVITAVSKNPNVIDLKWIPNDPGTVCKVAQAFPVVLKVLRLAHGMSQRQFAAKLGIPRTYVSKLENLGATPTLGSLEHISMALDTTPFAILRMCEAAA